MSEYDLGNYFRQAKKDYEDSAAGRLYQKTIDAFNKRYGDYYYTFFHLTEFPDSNVNSVINHSLAVGGIMEKYLAYLGYDIQVIDRASDPKLVDYAKQVADLNQLHSYDVMETDRFIIATLTVP